MSSTVQRTPSVHRLAFEYARSVGASPETSCDFAEFFLDTEGSVVNEYMNFRKSFADFEDQR